MIAIPKLRYCESCKEMVEDYEFTELNICRDCYSDEFGGSWNDVDHVIDQKEDR